ncbi:MULTISPECIES: hypothetical protein [Frankia]|uniref:Uncharacterized protein n=1 Tax=Frankia alni (strain DSM 45986 / CECT 9034 / ACN14a) TaxID=326424 RepID=Q0RBP5_FRAAA|nr:MULTISPECIES: hypothetical protein [Frankia]CAJ65139.1 hypothetical protein; putative membrane protein [Frankia alni ACN14a]
MRGRRRPSARLFALPRLLLPEPQPRLTLLPTVALRLVLAAVFAAVRLYGALFGLGFVLLWHHWYAGHPLGLLVAALAAGWSLTFALVALRRGIGWVLAAGNVVAALVLAAGARLWLPPESVGDSASFVLLAATHATAVAAWTFPAGPSLAVTVLTAGAFVAGAAGTGPPSPMPLAAIVCTALLVRYARPQVCALAGGAQSRLAEVAERRAGEQDVLTLLRERREHELTIHNAVLNTLTGIAWGGGADGYLTRRRCADGATALDELVDERELPSRAAPGCLPAAGGILAAARGPTSDEGAAGCLPIDCGPAGDVLIESGLAGDLLAGDVPVGDVPVGSESAGEAHRGAGRADPWARVAPAAGLLRALYTAQLRHVTGRFAALWLILLVLPAGRALPHVRSIPLALALLLAPLAAVAVARRRFRSGPLTPAQAAAVVLLCLGIAVGGGWNAGEAGEVRMMAWPLVSLPPLVMLVTVSRPVWRWVLASVTVGAAMIAVSLLTNPRDPFALSHLLMQLYYLWIMQICLVMVGPLLWSTADVRAWASHCERELVRRAENRDRVRERRSVLLRAVERDVAPLLAGVAAGRLDPQADAVRSECARRAVAVRRLLFDDDAVHSALGEAIDAAERHGTVVSSQISGGLDQLPASVRGEFVEQVHHALRVMPSRRVLLTVTAQARTASLFLSCSWPAGQLPPAPSGRAIDMIVDVDDGQLCMELRWPPAKVPLGRRP